MKLLVFAHVPPPHHGQSYMVKLMLDGFGGDHRHPAPGPARVSPFGIECYHVDARLSQRLEHIGDVRVAKLVALIGYCLQAIWCRYRHGVTNLYYIPGPGKRSAVYRDWVVMLLCRPFFDRVVLHWHAAGMGKWLERAVQSRARSFTYERMREVDLSVVLSQFNRLDAEKLCARRVEIVGNGIPDPCPDYAATLQQKRRARRDARAKLLAGTPLSPETVAAAGGDAEVFRILYLAHCTREKGLFDTIEAVALVNLALVASRSPVQIELTVAGDFMEQAERRQFDARIARPDLQNAAGKPVVTYAGFVSGQSKTRALAEADCFCFPTFYYAESFGLVLAEAMAFGVPSVTTRWRSIPELYPADYPGLVDPQSPPQIAAKLREMLTLDLSDGLRRRFEERYTLDQHLRALANALRTLETTPAQ